MALDPVVKEWTEAGHAYLVATPIGNLADFSDRGRAVLAAVDLILAEDTRVTRGLLRNLGIRAQRLEAFHAHNWRQKLSGVLDALRSGKRVALVTDAGMPAISDPGQELCAALWEAGLPFSVIPGPSAETFAFAASGFPHPYLFWGFLPAKGKARKARLDQIRKSPYTQILYEAPHRMPQTLRELATALGTERTVVMGRELTKWHEELWRGNLAALAERDGWRGEVVLVIGPASPGEDAATDPTEWAELIMAVKTLCQTEALPLKQAAKQIAAAHKIPVRDLYARVVNGEDSPLEPR